MKKAIIENESDTLVIDEIPANAESKKKSVVSPSRVRTDTADDSEERALDEKIAKRQALLKNISADQHGSLKEWQRKLHSLEKKRNALIAESLPLSDLMIFQLNDDHTTVKTEWSNLPSRLKEVFEEVIYSLPLSGFSSEDNEGCYTFSYSDDEFNLSVISIVIEGKAALFYKNDNSSES